MEYVIAAVHGQIRRAKSRLKLRLRYEMQRDDGVHGVWDANARWREVGAGDLTRWRDLVAGGVEEIVYHVRRGDTDARVPDEGLLVTWEATDDWSQRRLDEAGLTGIESRMSWQELVERGGVDT